MTGVMCDFERWTGDHVCLLLGRYRVITDHFMSISAGTDLASWRRCQILRPVGC